MPLFYLSAMNISVLTILPGIFDAYLNESIIGRALEKGIVQAQILNLRDFAHDKHKCVDDTPYGGGPGMVMKTEPFGEAFEHILSDGIETHTILLSPQGKPFSQKRAEELAKDKRRLLFVCGRYEGIDERVVDEYVDEEISVGDYVLTGGELPALVIIDAALRLVPGVVGDEDSLEEESFSWGILDYPHYTRPQQWKGRKVPDVLMSGHHLEIKRYRRKEALRHTLLKRPDLLHKASLTEEDRKVLDEIKEESK
jgi:tRNA (guanine37-N1)-methyltransferase